MMSDKYDTENNGDRINFLEAEIKKVKAERDRLENILFSLDTGLSLINPDSTISWVNNKIRAMFPDGEPIGKICHRFYESSDNKCAPCPTFQSFQNGCVEEIERFNPANKRWYRIISQPIKSPDGQVINVLEGITEITERKQAEIMLAENERNMSAILNNTHDGVVRIDRDFKHIFANSALYTATGLTPEKYLGKTNEEIGMNEQLCSFWRKKHQKVFATGKPDYFEFSYPTVDKGERTFQAAVCPEFNDNKEVETIISFMRDITELKQTEKVILEKEEMYRNLFENAPIGIGIADEKGNILDFNDAILHPGGYSREDIAKIGNLSEFYCDWNVRDQVLKKAFEQGYLDEAEVQFRRKDGTPYDALLSLRPIQSGGKSCWQAMVQDVTDRKKAEQLIQQARLEWEGIFQAIGHPTLILDGNHRLIHANAATEKATGKLEKDLLGKTCYEIFHNTDEPPEECPFEKMIKSGHLETLEMEIEALGGSFLVSCTPMLDEKGRIEKVIHIATDISDRKRAEEALRASEERHRMMIEHMSSGVAVYETKDDGGTFVFKDVNPAAERISKIKKEKTVGRELLALFPKMDQFGLVDALRRVWKTGQNERLHAGYYRDDLRQGWRDNRIYKLPSGEVVAIYDDVTEQKEAERKIEESEKRLRRVLETVALVAIMLNSKGQLIFCNDFFLNLTGWTRKEVLGKDWFDIFVPVDIRDDLKRSIFSKALQAGEFPEHYENEIVTRSGEKRLIAWNNTVFFNEKGDVTETASIGENITDRRKSEERLRQAQKMEAIATLAGGIAHDYNNLLAIIIGNLSLAREETDPHSAMTERLHQIEQASYRAKDLTHQFLTLSRGGHPRKELHSIESLLKEVQGQLQTNEHIKYIFSIQDDLWPVEHDSKQMQDAITNVLKNAVEAMPQGGAITVQVENRIIDNKDKGTALPLNKGRYVRISIKDEGPGIPEEQMNKVFDPYFSTKARGVQKGMGLGLTTAYAVVEKHGGHITLRPTTGVGTTVNIYLPASDFVLENSVPQGGVGLKAREESKQPPSDSGQSSIRRILVMDDEESLRNLAQEMLARLGYEVETVKDGAEALEKCKKYMDSGEPFDGVILDLTIKGGMGGVQTIKELIKIDPDVKAIVCSGYFNDPVLAHFEEHGFKGSLAKPYAMKALKDVLERLFE